LYLICKAVAAISESAHVILFYSNPVCHDFALPCKSAVFVSTPASELK